MTLSPLTTSTLCDRFDCGHITRSASRAVKRAAFLYRAECEPDIGYLGGREDAHTLAALALMREGADCRAVLVAGGADAASLTETVEAALPDLKITPRQAEVLGWVSLGYSFPEIGAQMGVAVETVRSLAKAAMRGTSTHSVIDAAVMAAGEGWI